MTTGPPVLAAPALRCGPLAPAVLFMLALLSGCAGAPPAPPPVAEAPPPAPEVSVPPPPDPLVPFVQRWQREAESAEQQGRLADALWAREALALAVPAEARPAAQADVARLRAAIDARVQEALARGREAQRRGDADRAQRAWLQALLLDPGQATAADALRAMERERNERQWLGRFSRNVLRAPAAADRPGERLAGEHAALLAGQGDVDGAIQLLARAVQAPRADPALRLQLADLHVRRARSLPPDRRADAVAALREALRLEPRHEAAREALAQIAPEAAGASAAPAARAPSPRGVRSAP